MSKSDDLRKDLGEIRDMVWGGDIPHQKTPEYREWHEKCQKFLARIDAAIDKYDKA